MKIIAQSPIIKPSPCTSRGCVVIREDDHEYVVHNAEADKDGQLVAFYWGHYFHKSDPDALDRAVAVFVRKTLTWHGLSSTYELVPIDTRGEDR
jgi:hypothetical protein